MLFNSPAFLLYFLPLTLAVFVLLTRLKMTRSAVAWLTIASLFFYGWWQVGYVPLLLGSTIGNYALGRSLGRTRSDRLLVLGIAGNLLLLGYYKYTGFLIQAADQIAGLHWTVPHILLPLAMSFFTFQQIAYLVDAHDGVAVEQDFMNYCLFITFFPHLIAGPITHHREMLPQFGRLVGGSGEVGRGAVGLTLFFAGLFKKVVIADPFGLIAGPVFAAVGGGQIPDLKEAWVGVLSYALQIYFDFSGYTDMAIGLGLLFGISLPPNFNSPYKAHNVVEFWSRWHMTLTRFLTAYVYNPLTLRITRARLRAGLSMPRRGRSTVGAFATMVALPSVLTMFLSGVWHGAGWQFIVFGLLHGAYLAVNHGWRALKRARGRTVDGGRAARAGSVLLTFLCVLVALVFFRADSVGAALRLLRGALALAGGGAAQDLSGPALAIPYHGTREIGAIAAGLLVVWFLPNVTQWMRHYQTALDAAPRASWLERRLPATTWRPSLAFGFAIGAIAMFASMRALSGAPTEFLYFQF